MVGLLSAVRHTSSAKTVTQSTPDRLGGGIMICVNRNKYIASRFIYEIPALLA